MMLIHYGYTCSRDIEDLRIKIARHEAKYADMATVNADLKQQLDEAEKKHKEDCAIIADLMNQIHEQKAIYNYRVNDLEQLIKLVSITPEPSLADTPPDSAENVMTLSEDNLSQSLSDFEEYEPASVGLKNEDFKKHGRKRRNKDRA